MRITYLFDPLCGWCYGAGPVIARIARLPGVTLDLVPVGLFSGRAARKLDQTMSGFVWSNDQRIARLTGRIFSQAYRNNILALGSHRLESGPSTLALTAVRLAAADAELSVLNALHEARYVRGLDTTDPAILADLLAQNGLIAAADRFLARDAELRAVNDQRVRDGQVRLRTHRIHGVPALIGQDGGSLRVLEADDLFRDPDRLIFDLTTA